MKFLIALVVGTAMWFGVDLIYDNSLEPLTAPWWCEIGIVSIGVIIANILSY